MSDIQREATDILKALRASQAFVSIGLIDKVVDPPRIKDVLRTIHTELDNLPIGKKKRKDIVKEMIYKEASSQDPYKGAILPALQIEWKGGGRGHGYEDRIRAGDLGTSAYFNVRDLMQNQTLNDDNTWIPVGKKIANKIANKLNAEIQTTKLREEAVRQYNLANFSDQSYSPMDTRAWVGKDSRINLVIKKNPSY